MYTPMLGNNFVDFCKKDDEKFIFFKEQEIGSFKPR